MLHDRTTGNQTTGRQTDRRTAGWPFDLAGFVASHREPMDSIGMTPVTPRPLTIGIIAPPWLPVPPLGYGGTETVLDVLARSLQRAGHQVRLFTTGDSSCPVPRRWCFPEAIGVGNGGPVDEIRHVLEAYEVLDGVDVVHDHTLVGPLYALSLRDRAVVTTNHGPFNSDLLPLYRRVSTRVPVIAISNHQASTAHGLPVA